MTTISINAEYLHLAHLFTTTDDTRYYLKGVQVEPHPTDDGILIIATDGHKAAVFYDQEGYVSENMLIAFDKPFLASLKQERNENFIRRVTVRHDRLVTMSTDTDGELFEEKHIKPGPMLIDGTFPDWRRIMPDITTPGPVPAFNAAYIKIFQQVSSALTGAKSPSIRITAQDLNGLCRFQ